MSDHSLLYITFENKKQALEIGELLVDKELCACVNILGPIESIYRWKGKVEHANEVSAIAKTKTALVEKVIMEVKKHHSYECPCIISLSIDGGNEAFLKWIGEEAL